MNHYPHHIGDFNNATRHLTRVERALYRDLLDRYYDTELPLPADDFEHLAKVILASKADEKAALKQILLEFFTIKDGLYHNNRCDKEIAKYHALIATASRAGKASAEKRFNKKATRVQRSSTSVERSIDSGSTNQNQNQNQEVNPTGALRAPPAVNGSEAKTALVWIAYSSAYRQRYGTDPTRNKKVNSLLARLIERVPTEEAPDIAAFYLTSERGLYTSAHHCVDLLLRDAEALRTEWQTGRHEVEIERKVALP